MTKVSRTLEDNLITALGVIGLVVNGLIFLLYPYLWLVPVATLLLNTDPGVYLGVTQISLLAVSAIIFIGVPYIYTHHFKHHGLTAGLFWGFLNFVIAMLMDLHHNEILQGQSGLEPYTSASAELFFSTFLITITLPAILGYLTEKRSSKLA